jgi:hypothetical protein
MGITLPKVQGSDRGSVTEVRGGRLGEVKVSINS